MVVDSRPVTAISLFALITGPLACCRVSTDIGRAAMATVITRIDATNDTTTILRWVVRSAVANEVFRPFMGLLPRPWSMVSVAKRTVQGGLGSHAPIAVATYPSDRLCSYAHTYIRTERGSGMCCTSQG